MGQEVEKRYETVRLTNDQIALIKRTVAKGATDDELKIFTMIASKYGLDPFLKEIWFIKRAKKEKKMVGGREQWDYKRLPNGDIDYSTAETLIMTSRDGYLKIAQSSPDFIGIIGFAVRDGDSFEIDAEHYRVMHRFGGERGKIIGAWSKVDRAGRQPVIQFADFSEYNDSKSTTWQKYPSAMILKVAEVLALKRQFGINGLVTQEELSVFPDEIIPVEKPETPEKPITETPVSPADNEKLAIKRKQIHDMIDQLSAGDKDAYSAMVIRYSAFEKDNKTIAKDDLEDIKNERWLNAVYGKVKKEYENWIADK